jgi:hypothetical protein
MTSFFKPLAAAVLLATAGSAANATTYDLSYETTFEYRPGGMAVAHTGTGTLAGQLEGTATANIFLVQGVDFSSFSSLTFTDTYGNVIDLLERGPMLDPGSGQDFLAFSSALNSRMFTLDGTYMNGFELMMTYGLLDVFHTPIGSAVTNHWVADARTNAGTWSLTEHVTSPVPEPATAVLALLGAPLLAWRARRPAMARAG